MKVCSISPGQEYEPAVIALGNFDGVHIGHQRLLRCGLEKAKELKVRLAVLLFDPHPLKVLYPEKKLNLLTSSKERLRLFEEIGVDKVFFLPFTQEIANTSPQNFVERILLKIGASHVVVGFNYSFGAKGKGTPQDLERFGKKYGFGVSIVKAQKIDGKIISSSEIRRLLLAGDITAAKEMMGRPPKIVGTVVHGDKRGRKLGFPTANILPEEDLLVPKNGVYAVTAEIEGRLLRGMMNIGVKPTFNSQQEKTVEIYFFDYQGDLYGKELVVNIEERLRAERKFTGVEEIITQLNKDKEQAQRVLACIDAEKKKL